AEATGSEDMDRVRRSLPKLARDLLGEGVSARHVCAVVSNVLRDMTARATELAEQSLINDGWGEAPARWSMLVLGSAGRGESLLVFDQDHAIVHTGGEAEDAWFAELGKRVADTLNAAGIPYCEGKVMSSTPQWRRSLENWRREISDWVLSPGEQTVMNTDIFFDLQPVHGDAALAEELRGIAISTAQTSSFFLQFLGMHVARMDVPIGIFGEFVTTHGRLNAKKYGLLPLVSAARARAIRAGIHVTNTYDRYAALCESGLMHPDDLISLGDVHELMLKVMLEQQLADLAAGIAPSARIEPRRLDRGMQSRLKAAFKRIRTLKSLIGINA
ncbi:MAG: histidine kinase, partial [Rhodospirillales bacterium]|nr:histidine kinase [Rhodospirillales bacterium]